MTEKHTPRADQEIAIEAGLAQIGTSDGVLIGDEPGFGKTTIGAELILRAGWQRVLLIGLGDTHAQWDERLRAQSDGARGVRIMNGSAAGRAEFEAFMRHEPGIFIATADFLREKDWETITLRDDQGRPRPELDKKSGDRVFKARKSGPFQGELLLIDRAEGQIGPAQTPKLEKRKTAKGVIGPALEPVYKTKSDHKGVYRKFARKPLDAVIFDECQAIANKSSNTRRTILSIKASYRAALSGTWFLNALENMWSVARWVWPGENPATGLPYVESSHDRWKARFLESEAVTGRGGKQIETKRGTGVTRVVGEKVPGEFVSTLPCYIRRENEPVPAPEVVYCDATPRQREQMDDLQKDLMTWVRDWQGEEMPLVVDMPPILRMRLRQVAIAELSMGVDPETGKETVFMADDAASAKLLPLRNLLDIAYAGQPVAIYTDSKIGAHFIAQRMRRAGYDARAWTGDLSRPEREKLKQAFIGGEFPYLISTIQSFGTGLDGFQRRANKVIWISEADGNPALNEQAIRRYFRPGMTKEWGGFQHVKLVMKDSVDEISLAQLIEKAWAVRNAMQGGIAA
ncbi:MAG: hypothetical protein K0Q52_159 [Microbacterium sp.]|jgi:hypothetical protein|nr:hypothetical protein [Microbacterium sp.]